MRNSSLEDSISVGDRVTIVTPHGQLRTGRAVMRGPAGWVLNMGGPHGTPGIASDENIVKVSKKASRRPKGGYVRNSSGKDHGHEWYKGSHKVTIYRDGAVWESGAGPRSFGSYHEAVDYYSGRGFSPAGWVRKDHPYKRNGGRRYTRNAGRFEVRTARSHRLEGAFEIFEYARSYAKELQRELGVETFIADTHLVKEYPGDARVVWRSEEHPCKKNCRWGYKVELANKIERGKNVGNLYGIGRYKDGVRHGWWMLPQSDRELAHRMVRVAEKQQSERYTKNGRRIPRAVPEVSTCRTQAPAKYRRLGATSKNDYAFPECWMYPIRMRSEKETMKHIRLAASRFAKHGHRYPKWVREKIDRRLDAAKKRYGIGQYHVRKQRRRAPGRALRVAA